MIKKTFKKNLLTTASAFAIGAFAAAGANAAALVGNEAAAGDSYTLEGDITLSSNLTANTNTNPLVRLTSTGAGNTLTTSTFSITAGDGGAGGDAVDTVDDNTDNLTVSVGGLITTAGAGGSFAIDVNHNIGTITNSGTIQSSANNANVIDVAVKTVTALVNNSVGTISANGSGSAIDIADGGAITNITNAGSITSTTTGTALHFVGASASTLVNTGTINAGAGGKAIDFGGAITGTATNGSTTVSTALLGSAGGVAVDIGGNISLGFHNYGAITETTGTAISVTGAMTTATTGGITNYSTGVIQSDGTAGPVIIAADVAGGLSNAGVIKTTAGASAVIAITGAQTTATAIGNVLNTGSIQAAGTGNGITITADLAGALNNTAGTITSAAGHAITTDSAITGGIANTGTIKSTSGNFAGINVSASKAAAITNTGTTALINANGTSGAIHLTGAVTLTGAITNTLGTISNTAGAAAAGSGIDSSAGVLATGIVNTGTISTTNTGAASGIRTAAISANGIANNLGLITTAGTSGAIQLVGDVDIVGDITNSGTISSTNATPVAIDTSSAAGKAIGITNTGTIIGAIALGTTDTITNTSGTITGNITAAAGGVNTITMTAGTLTGNITLGTGADVVQYNGGSIVGNITLGATAAEAGDNIKFGDSNADSVTVTGTLGFDDIDVDFGTATLTGLATGIDATSTTEIDAGATLISNGGITNAGVITVNGTLAVAAGKEVGTAATRGALAIGSAGVVRIGVASASSYGKVVGAAITAAAGSTIAIDPTNIGYIATGTDLVDVIDTSSTATSFAYGTLAESTESYIYSFVSKQGTADGDVTVTVNRANTFNSAGTNANNSAAGSALETIALTGDTGLDAIVNELNGMSTAAQINTALETLNPDISGAITGAAVSAAGTIGSVVGGRLDQLAGISGSSATGVATGGMSYDSGIWGEAFGAASDQGYRKGIRGYQGDTYGFAVGADTKFSDQGTVGVSIAYANTDADSANGTAEIDSIQGNVYGTYDYGKWYSEGLIGFTHNSFDTTRNVTVGSIANRASASFNGQQYTARFGGGYKLDVEGGLNVTPVAALQYDYITTDKYTETGSTANLAVDNDDLHILKTDIGVNLNYPIVDGVVTYIPEIKAGWEYDLVGDEQTTTSNFTGAASTLFSSKGAKVAQHAFKLGVGLDVLAQDNMTVSFDYDWTGKEDYNSHSGSVKARFAF